MVPRAAGQVLGDVGVDQPGAAGLEIDEGVADIRLSLPQGFNLGAVKNQAGLEFLHQNIVVGGGAVLGDPQLFGLLRLLGWFGHAVQLYVTTALNLSREGVTYARQPTFHYLYRL